MAIFTISSRAHMAGVNPAILDIIQKAAAAVPASISKVEVISGKDPRGYTKNHPAGLAIDVKLYDAKGQEIYNEPVGKNPLLGATANVKTAKAFTAYQTFANVAKDIQHTAYPSLDSKFAWGGYFGPDQKGRNAADLMHFDIGKARGTLGNFNAGLNPAGLKMLPGAVSVGMLSPNWRDFGFGATPTPPQDIAANVPLPRQAPPTIAAPVTPVQRGAMLSPPSLPASSPQRAPMAPPSGVQGMPASPPSGIQYPSGPGSPLGAVRMPGVTPSTIGALTAQPGIGVGGLGSPSFGLNGAPSPSRLTPDQGWFPNASFASATPTVNRPPLPASAPPSGQIVRTGAPPPSSAPGTLPLTPQEIGARVAMAQNASLANQPLQQAMLGGPPRPAFPTVAQDQRSPTLPARSAYPTIASDATGFPQQPRPVQVASLGNGMPPLPQANPFGGSLPPLPQSRPAMAPLPVSRPTPPLPQPNPMAGMPPIPTARPAQATSLPPLPLSRPAPVQSPTASPAAAIAQPGTGGLYFNAPMSTDQFNARWAAITGQPVTPPTPQTLPATASSATAPKTTAQQPLSAIDQMAQQYGLYRPTPNGVPPAQQPIPTVQVAPPPLPLARPAPVYQDPTPGPFQAAKGLPMIGGMLGSMLGGPLGGMTGRAVGQNLASSGQPRFAPSTNYLGSGMSPISMIMGGGAPPGSYAMAQNNAPGSAVGWSNTGPGGSPMQTVTFNSGHGYNTYSSAGQSFTSYF